MERRTIFHGSPYIISEPLFGKGKSYNDYGLGFYCTEDEDLAKEWASTAKQDGFVNQYTIDESDLLILNLSKPEYSALNWLALLLENRKISTYSAISKDAIEWIKENYLLDTRDYDIIIGYRADDSYFSFARAFVSNTISLEKLSEAMLLGNLGKQYVLKSQKAFSKIQHIDSVKVNGKIYYAKRISRDETARKEYEKSCAQSGLNGTYIRDIMLGNVSVENRRGQNGTE